MLNLIENQYRSEYNYLKEKLESLNNHELTKAKDRKSLHRDYIISMYSLLEGTLNKAVYYYLKELTSLCSNFDDLSNTLIKKHEEKSLTLLSDIKRSKYRALVNEKEIIQNLASCYTKNEYKLNHYAFINNTKNYRYKEVKELIESIGIENFFERIFEEKVILKYFNNLNIKNSKIMENFFKKINTLSNERNKIAHNIYNSEVLGYHELLKILDILNFICEGLLKILVEDILSKKIKNHIKITPTNYFNSPKIVEIKNISTDIYVDKEIYINVNDKIKKLSIDDLRVFSTESKFNNKKTPIKITSNVYAITFKSLEKPNYIYFKKKL